MVADFSGLYGHGRTKDEFYIVLDKLGPSLAGIIKERKKVFTVKTAAMLGIEIVRT